MHARSDAADEVYAVDLANHQLPMTLDDWLDKALLALLTDLEEITVQVGAEDTKKTWQLRNDLAQGWLLDNAKADQAAVLSYLGQLQNLRVIGLAEMGAIVSHSERLLRLDHCDGSLNKQREFWCCMLQSAKRLNFTQYRR